MKIRNAFCAAAAAAAIGGLTPAIAQTIYQPVYEAPPAAYPVERIYVPGLRDNGALHGGWVAPGDEILLSDTLNAISNDRRTAGATVTMVANNGEIIMNGTATDVAQAARMERIAKQVAGGRVTAWFDQPGA